MARHDRTGRTNPAVCLAHSCLDIQAKWPVRESGDMSDALTTPAPVPASTSRLAHLAPYVIWMRAAAVLILLPVIFRSGTALTMMSLMGISVIFALSYNMLLGQTGMLSFGHAVYYGLGAYFTVHSLNVTIAAGA